MKRLLTLIACAGLFAGCHSPMANLSPMQCHPSYYGSIPASPKSVVTAHLDNKLIPIGGVYHIVSVSEPFRGYTRRAPIIGGKPHEFGYFVTVLYEQDTFFMRTRIHRVNMLLRDGKVIAEIAGQNRMFKESWYNPLSNRNPFEE